MPRLDRWPAKYSIQSSPFWRLGSRSKLAQLIGWQGSVKELELFVRRADNYNEFLSQVRSDKKPRQVQQPKEAMERLHRRIASLLLRIRPPEYLHSGLRGRSFVSNARVHRVQSPAIKLDIQKFYPSTTWQHVYQGLLHTFGCQRDVAALLACILCLPRGGQGHLPTGSCASQIVAFYAHKRMFDAIAALATSRGGLLTLYVDDMVLSLPDGSPADIAHTGRLVSAAGLHWHKARFFAAHEPKLITGVIMKRGVSEPDKKQHRKFQRSMAALDQSAAGTTEHAALGRRAIGILESIQQVDESGRGARPGMIVKLRREIGALGAGNVSR